MQTERRPDRAGLTLVEVLLALVILGIGAFSMVTTISRSLAVVRQSRDYEKARDLLARVELEHPIDKEELREGSESGSFSGQESQYRWLREITVEGEEEDGLYSVRTRISWTERGRETYEEVMTYLFVPEEKRGGTFERPNR
jgi:prepilin-type N-terminal cleavage/methylation domain-containing protein